jgi:tripartite-type tricarboxylate transporter receptor subunit TctC
MNRFKHILAAAGLTAFALTAGAQTFPARPIKIIVPFSAGTATDLVTRLLAPVLSEQLRQTVVVDNRAGADGAIGAQEVARAPADGYTLLMSTNGFAAVPAMRKSPPYHPTKDFTPVSMVGRYAFFLLVNSAVPARSLKELLDYARANPGTLNYATGNPTGIIASSQMLSLADVKMVGAPYKGEPAAMTDLATNRVQVMFATMTTAGPHVASGKLRVLATTLPTRLPSAPDIPTIAEAGLPKFSVASWAALQGPANMPREVTQRLSRAVAVALTKPEIRDAFAKQNIVPLSSTPEELRNYVHDQVELYARTLKEAGVEPE